MSEKHKKRSPLMIVLAVLSVCLAVLCVTFGLFGYRFYSKYGELKETTLQLQQDVENQKKLVRDLEEKANDLTEKLAEKEKELEDKNTALREKDEELEEERFARTQAEQAQSAAQQPEAQEGQISPPAGDGSLLQIEAMDPGMILDTAAVRANPDAYFTSSEITVGDPVYERINGKSYRENPNVALSDLRYLKMAHYNFNHEVQVGEMITNAAIAEDVINIFKELFQAEYEVQSMYLVDNYWTGDGNSTDTASIDVNNTSCFNYRPVTSGGNLSNHAYGRAIDINPQQNPYVWYSGGALQYSHENAAPYIDRTSGDPHVVVAGDVCYNIFAKYGFSWGGNWANPIDYQHFEKPY